jgi:hypothetical protein
MRPSPLNPMPTLRTRQNQATAAKDRLQPALLDRLTSANRPSVGRYSTAKSVVWGGLTYLP